MAPDRCVSVAPDGISTLRYVPGPPVDLQASISSPEATDGHIKVATCREIRHTLWSYVGPGQPCEDDLLELNNQPLKAGTQNNLSLCQFDVDYYSVSLAAGEALEHTALQCSAGRSGSSID